MMKVGMFAVIAAAGIAVSACTSADPDLVRSCDAPVTKYGQLCGTDGLSFVRNSCESAMSDDTYACWVPCITKSTTCTDAKACCAQ